MSSTCENRIGKLPVDVISTEIEVIKERRARILCQQSEKYQKNDPSLDVGNPAKDSVGLALSGGGIRSAIFNLGLLQALHEKRRIGWVDYLSTVSGGGYISACLLWMKNSNSQFHNHKTFPFPRLPQESELAVNAIAWLRSHGSYLNPGSGLKSWAFAAAILRGTFINLFIVLPLILLFMFVFSAQMTASIVNELSQQLPLNIDPINYEKSRYVYCIFLFISSLAGGLLLDHKIKKSIKTQLILKHFYWIERGAVAVTVFFSSIILGLWVNDIVTFTKERPVALVSFLVGCILLIRLGVNYLAYAFCSNHKRYNLKYDLHRFISEQYGKLLLWSFLLISFGCLPMIHEIASKKQYFAIGTLLSGLSGLGSFLFANLIQEKKDAIGKRLDETRGKLSLLINGGGILLIGCIVLSLYHLTNDTLYIYLSQNWSLAGPFWITVLIAIISVVIERKANMNRVSMWRYYRNRLMEGFFPSFGFFGKDDFRKCDHLISKLCQPSDKNLMLSRYLFNNLKSAKGQTFKEFSQGYNPKSDEDGNKKILCDMFNGIIQNPRFCHESGISSDIISKRIEELDQKFETRKDKKDPESNRLQLQNGRWLKIQNLKHNLNELSRNGVSLLNRLVLDDAFSEEIEPYIWNPEEFFLHTINVSKIPTPYPIFNTALITSDSGNEKFGLRGCDNFIFTPKYIGSDATSYFETKMVDPEFSVPDAIATSGAAIDPNTGETKSWVLSLLMGLLNLRLGYWMKHPKYPDRTLGFWSKLAWSEMRGVDLNEQKENIRLSDGAHFDSLGLYELIRRQCKIIIVSDATWDPQYHFSYLGRVIEKVRIDFNAEIKIDTSSLTPTHPSDDLIEIVYKEKTGFSPQSWEIGKVIYKDKSEGTILFIKTSMISGLPEDVLSYKRKHPKFPDEPTTDQFFDEEQFEAYRELGYCCGSKALKDLFSMETFDDSQNWFRQCLADPEKHGDQQYLRTKVDLQDEAWLSFLGRTH
jgi:Patatin-like phospholipase